MSLRLSRPFLRLAAAALLCAATAAGAQSRVVVTSPADDGPGTLREAIRSANANADRTTIDFAIDSSQFGSGPWQIALRSSLPEFTAPVLVRGFSQAGSVPPTSTGNGRPMIELSSDAASRQVMHFVRGSEGSAVTGLAFVGGRANSPALLIMANNVRASANHIGIHADGRAERYEGVGIGAVCADSIVIGGDSPADGNVIYGTSTALMLTGTGHRVRHNWIGMDLQGGSQLAGMVMKDGLIAGTIGVSVAAHLQTMYSPAVQQSFFGLRDALIADNRFAHAGRDGVRLLGANNPTRGNRIQRNVFGRDIWSGPDAYVDIAVRLSNGALDNEVSENLIGRANAGILLGDALESPPTLAGHGNRLSRNLVFETAYPMIGLDAERHFAPLANDPLDADDGANALQNKPDLSIASTAGGIEGELQAAANTDYTLEFFLGASCHASGYGTADFFLGSASVRTDAGGRAAIAATATQRPLGGLQAGDVISATATDPGGNTSELTRCIGLTAAVTPSVKLDPLPSPIPAMDTTLGLGVSVQGNGQRQPTGEVSFVVRTATGQRELGRLPLQGGNARLPTPPQGFFVNPGRYEIFAEYLGDGFHNATSSVVSTVVVFRPSIATVDPAFSSPARRNSASGDREFAGYAVPPTGSWSPLSAKPDDTWLDADRFWGERIDRMLVRDVSGVHLVLDTGGGRAALNSNAIRGGAQVVDLLQADQDVRADAIVRDPSAGWLLVHCVFLIDNCERAERLDINLEYEFLLSGEFNGDGFADLAWRNRSSGEIIIWLMDGQKPQQRYTLRPPVRDASLAAAVDVNGDGYEDLVWSVTGGRTFIVSLMYAGTPRRDFTAQLPSPTSNILGSVHVAIPGQPDYGTGQVLLHDTARGEVLVLRDARASGTTITTSPQSLYADPAYVPERLR